MSTMLVNKSGEWWDFAMVLSLAFVALAGVAVLIFTYGSVTVHKREAKAAEAALGRYKAETARDVVSASKAASDAAQTAYSAGQAAGLAQAGLVAAQAKIKSAERDIVDANRIAAQATELAAKLGLKVDQLPAFVHQKQIELNALAASMTKSSDQLNDARKAAEAAQANAEIALGTLRREAQGRSLSDKQSAYLTSVLRDKDLPKILVQSESGDTESYPYAMQILSAIKKAGRTAEYQTWPSVFMWFNEPGVFIVSNAHVKKQHTAALIDALNGSGVKVEEAQTSEDTALRDPRPEIISIVVWKKPLPKRP